MDIDQVLQQLDTLFNAGDMGKVEAFLSSQYHYALDEKKNDVALGILNEQIGFYRVTTQYEKAMVVIQNINELIRRMHLEDTIEEATSLLNIATIYRAMGRNKDAKECYLKTEKIYADKLEKGDYRIAGLYNNMSLLYMEQGAYKLAIEYLEKALPIISAIPDCEIQAAVTHTNMGQAYCRLEMWEEAKVELNLAEEIFGKTNIHDEHYGGCANAQGYLYLQLKDYKKAIFYYEKALLNVYQAYGKTEIFKNIQNDLKKVYILNGNEIYESMLDVCKAYYEQYGKPMIQEKFPQYVGQIAVGLCGEGSECLGLEDEISLDHDCGPGFAMWVSDSVYDEIGQALQEEYDKLPKVFAGFIRIDTKMGTNRCGVCKIEDYYKRVLGGKNIPESEDEWEKLEESALATAISGRIFTDPEGLFCKKREQIEAYYPEKIWKQKLARELIYAAQTGQYNYGRAMARGEYVTASIILSEYMQSIMHVVFLLNRTFMPYYKWQHRLMKKLTILPEVSSILEAICDMPSQREAWNDYGYNGNPNPKDMIAQTIEIIAKLVVHTLIEMGLSKNDNPYLEVQAQEVLNSMNESVIENKDRLIEEIVKLEWMEFDRVHNQGGRASCQDDLITFTIMRKSQYLTWTEDMLHEYLWHLDDSFKKGRNLIEEKYGRMMESTAPDEYARIKDSFPVLTEKRCQIMEEIIKIQVAWMEEFAKDYPKMAGNARSIHTYEDTPFNTSYETYLRGELGTYSEEMMSLYGQFIVKLVKDNKNLAYLTMENTAKLYGYESLEKAEQQLK